MASKKDEWKKEELQEMRVILIGKTGAGKSYLGNALLGRKEFKSSAIATSVIDSCAFGKQKITSRSRKYILKVIDTPGIKDNRLPEAEMCGELAKCLSLTLPGPHYFVIVVQIGRFTDEELDVVELLKREFGEGLIHFALVVFTHGSKLDEESLSIEDFLETDPPALKQVVDECNMKYAVIYDKSHKNFQKSVQNIIDLIVNSATLEDYYTNAMFKQANENKKMIIAKIEEDRNREINALKEEVEELKRKVAENCSKEERRKLKKKKERKEEALIIKETTSAEETYDIKVISDNSVAKATFNGSTSATAAVSGGGAVVFAVGGALLAVSGVALAAGSIIATGVTALTGTLMGLIGGKRSSSTTHIEARRKSLTQPTN